MFYSETLLAKTGPLARVWLAANLERKLTKQNVLQSNLEDNVKSIIAPGQAPLALRLSGQLLLGVVKIYSRKAGYLVEDCHDVLNKIKSAFRPGNVDLAPSHATGNPTTLTLPDAVTELDLFAPLPDPEELLRGNDERREPGRDPTLLDFGSSTLLTESSQTPSRKEKRPMQLEDIDIDGLEFGLGPNEQGERLTPMSDDRSIEIGRRADMAMRDDPTLLDDDINLGLNFGDEGNTTLGLGGPVQLPLDGDDVLMADDGYQVNDDDEIAANNAAAFARAEARAEERKRDSASPLSESDETLFQLDPNAPEDSTLQEVQAAQRVKRRKVMQQDTETQIHNSQIKKQQEDRSGITKQPQFLPRDPVLLQLMEMQRHGQFVSQIMGNGRMEGWAPELRGILSLEVVRMAGEKKRKRDSGIADVDDADAREKSPRLELPEEEDEGIVAGAGADFFHSDGVAPIMSDGVQPDFPHDDVQDESGYHPAFDTTEAPLLHPSQSGPVSLGTKTAVHVLREFFAPDHPKESREPPTPSKRVKAEALFQKDLCPPERTTRADATKMFFEMLVLGTKDAVKVEQEKSGSNGSLGGMIRVRGKRGLWGDWAEMGSTQGIGEEEAAVVHA